MKKVVTTSLFVLAAIALLGLSSAAAAGWDGLRAGWGGLSSRFWLLTVVGSRASGSLTVRWTAPTRADRGWCLFRGGATARIGSVAEGRSRPPGSGPREMDADIARAGPG